MENSMKFLRLPASHLWLPEGAPKYNRISLRDHRDSTSQRGSSQLRQELTCCKPSNSTIAIYMSHLDPIWRRIHHPTPFGRSKLIRTNCLVNLKMFAYFNGALRAISVYLTRSPRCLCQVSALAPCTKCWGLSPAWWAICAPWTTCCGRTPAWCAILAPSRACCGVMPDCCA